jgi:hypothetical protein
MIASFPTSSYGWLPRWLQTKHRLIPMLEKMVYVLTDSEVVQSGYWSSSTRPQGKLLTNLTQEIVTSNKYWTSKNILFAFVLLPLPLNESLLKWVRHSLCTDKNTKKQIHESTKMTQVKEQHPDPHEPCPNLAFHKMGMNQIQTNQLHILVYKLQQNTPHLCNCQHK